MKGDDDRDYKMEKTMHHVNKISVTIKTLKIYGLC